MRHLATVHSLRILETAAALALLFDPNQVSRLLEQLGINKITPAREAVGLREALMNAGPGQSEVING